MSYKMPGGKASAGGVWGRCPLHLRGHRFAGRMTWGATGRGWRLDHDWHPHRHGYAWRQAGSGAGYQVPGARYVVPGTWNLVLDT